MVCGRLETAAGDGDAITNPIVIVEVLSEATEARDRGRKRRDYQRLPSLREYVLVAQSEAHVEVWSRTDDGWRVADHGPGDEVALQSIGVTFSVDELYRTRLEAG